MKLTIILLIVTVMQLNATTFAQKVTYKQKSASLEQVFREIRKQTGYNVVWIARDLKKAQPLDVNFESTPLEEALNKMLEGLPLTYTIELKTIVIKTKDLDLKDHSLLAADTKVSGKILDEKGEGMAGAVIKVKGTAYVISAGSGGAFSINVPGSEAILIVSYVGYKTKEVVVSGADVELVVRMEVSVAELKEVAVVSTGYQTIAQERATGSFEIVNNKTFNYSPGKDILSHLEGNVASMVTNSKFSINTRNGPLSNVTLRGLSTLDPAMAKPLIVLDNMAYDGDLNNINPNDVESITVLKDAAAASIWGVRSGNGVIVILTKKGKYNQPLKISFNSNTRVAEKPRFNHLRELNSSDFIDLEKDLFDRGVINTDVTTDFLGSNFLSPVVSILTQRRDEPGSISQAEADAQIDALRSYSINDDLLKYIYRNQVSQQYAININQGSDKFNFLVSAGYDKSLAGVKGNSDNRMTLRSNVNLKATKNLNAGLSIGLARTASHAEGTMQKGYVPGGGKSAIYPYARLVDESGNPIPLLNTYRVEWAQEQGAIRGLDWTYVPLNDMGKTYTQTDAQDLLLKLNLDYKLSPVFKAQALYQYNQGGQEFKDVRTQQSYFMRDRINQYTAFTNNEIVRNLPLGGQLDLVNSDLSSQTLRGQINADKTWNSKHQLAMIAGAEIRQDNSKSAQPLTTFGWDENLLSAKTVDYNQSYPLYGLDWYTGVIGGSSDFQQKNYRYTSFYTNGSYTYNNRYVLSASARKDASNLFGVKSNQKGVPLWSAGASWNISNEAFYAVDWLPYLKFRTTYGYSGNVNNGLSAYTVMRYAGNYPLTNRPQAYITSPPNAELKWETVGMLNYGLDFGFKNGRLSGSVEYYTKKSKDIIASRVEDRTSGFSSVLANSAEIEGRGLDLILNSKNVQAGNFNWNTSFLFSHNKSKITKYDDDFSVKNPYNLIGSDGKLTSIKGYDPYAIFSYRFAGLDASGNPQGYLNGAITSAISDNAYYLTAPDSINKLVYHGSALPTTYGAIRNTLNLKGLELSANITYKLGYYFRKTSASYSRLASWETNSDLNDRWRVPGDETKTNIPGMPDFTDYYYSYRDYFYASSDVTVAKGDHIRLQDIMLSYTLNKPQWEVKNIRLYANMSNLGILWSANKWKLDPELAQGALSTPRILTFGLNANF